MIKLFNKEISDIYFGSKPVSAIYSGSKLVWTRSSGESDLVNYAVDGFTILSADTSRYNSLSGTYYRTSGSVIYNGESLPIYKTQDESNCFMFANSAHTASNVWELSGSTISCIYDDVSRPSYSDLYPENLENFEKNNGWFNNGLDESFSFDFGSEAPALAIQFSTTDSVASAYFNGIYEKTSDFTTCNGVQYPIYYCSSNGKYLYVQGDSGNPSGGSSNNYWVGRVVCCGNGSTGLFTIDAALDCSGFIRTDWLNENAPTSYELGENETFSDVPKFTPVVTQSTPAALTNVTLAGFTANLGFNGTYVNTGTTNTVSWYDYNAQESKSKSFPVFYNGSKYLYVTTNPFDSMSITWAVGSSPSSGNYYCSSTNNDGNLAVDMASETNGSWTNPSDYSSYTITAANTTSDTPTNDAPVITTGTLTITFSTNPSGAAWIVNGTQYSSGQPATLEAGTYTVTYVTVSGYDAPVSETVTVTANQTTSLTRAYTAQAVVYPDAFAVTGAPTNDTAAKAAINGNYVKQSQTTSYNGESYPVYYNGYYYLCHHPTSDYVCICSSSDMSNFNAGMPAANSSGCCATVAGMTSSAMTKTWSYGYGSGYYSLVFQNSADTAPSYGELSYPIDTTQPYLNVSGTSGYDGNYYLLSGTVDQPINTSSQNASSVWKHENNNWFILGFNTSSSDNRKGYHVYSSPNRTQLWGSYYPEGTKLASLTSTGTTTDSAYAFFNGGYTYGGVTTTLNMNGNSISPAEITFNYSTPSTDNGWSIYDRDNVLLSSGYNNATISLDPGNYKIRIYCPGSNGEYTISSMSSSPNVFNNTSSSITTGSGASPKTGASVYWRQHEATLSSGASVVINASFTEQSSCLVEGTMITLADGTKKPIEEITYDDELLCWDFDKGEYGSAKPATIKPVVYRDTYFINTFNDGSVLLTQGLSDKGHELFDMTQSKFDYNARIVGHDVFTQDGVKNLVSSQEVWSIEPKKIYHIITAQHYNLFADGVLTSVRLNNMYQIADMKYDKTQANVPAASEQLSQIPDQSLIEKFRMSEQPAKNFDYVLELSKQLQ